VLTSRRRPGVLPGISDDIRLYNQSEWENYCNYHRPHSSLSGQTPYERLLAKTRARTSPSF
jgi:hypothetical protein